MLYNDNNCVNSYYWSTLTTVRYFLSIIAMLVLVISAFIFIRRLIYKTDVTQKKKKINKICLIASFVLLAFCITLATYIDVRTSFYWRNLLSIVMKLLECVFFTLIICTVSLVIKLIRKKEDWKKHLKFYGIVFALFTVTYFLSFAGISILSPLSKESSAGYCWSSK